MAEAIIIMKLVELIKAQQLPTLLTSAVLFLQDDQSLE